MPSGGARARSGPAPDPSALRRERDAGEWVKLPASGRKGELPDWPLGSMSERETVLWTDLWLMPQAVMWEKAGQFLEVAFFVRRVVQVEVPDSPVPLGTLVRQMMDSLGLTTPGLRSHRWSIVEDAPAAAPAVAATSSRSRLKAVSDGRIAS